MNINVSCEKCGYSLEVIREWSERGDIEVTVMPCGCLQPTVDKKLREAIDFHAGRALELLSESRDWAAVKHLDTLLAVWGTEAP